MVKLENNLNTKIVLAVFALPNAARGLDEPIFSSF